MNDDEKTIAPFFATHHAPVGAWSSFTFGLLGKGVSIDHESTSLEETADFLVALSRGAKKVTAFPFIFGRSDGSSAKNWTFFKDSQIQRRLRSCVDEFSAEDMMLKVYTPNAEIPDLNRNPKAADVQYAVCPGILMELTVDNTQYDTPAHGLIGLSYRARGRIRPLDWSSDGTLSGIAFSGDWAMAAKTVENEVYTIRNNSIDSCVETGKKVIHNGGNEGGICFTVPPRTIRTLPVAFGFFHEGHVTQGLSGCYYYTKYFSSVEEVSGFILDHADLIRNDCEQFESKLYNTVEKSKYQIFCQTIRAYYACSQLTEIEGKPQYSVIEGQYLWRNTMDLTVDHLPYELWRNLWIVRNIMDLFISRYSYEDSVRFLDTPCQTFPGGLSFCHDMGNYTAYSPKGTSGYEMTDTGFYGNMTTEELLNGIYCISAYAIYSKDMDWIHQRSDIAVQLLQSMENRDYYDPLKRNGILKGESLRCGENGREITTYDALDASLKNSVGNMYIAVKTMCAALLLSEFFSLASLEEYAAASRSMARKTWESISECFDNQIGCFPASFYHDYESRIIAVLEPLAVPVFLGFKSWFSENVLFMRLFGKHLSACLEKGVCLDRTTGGLRLSSTSQNTWPSKVILCSYVMENLFSANLKEKYPTVLRELLFWTQTAAAEKTVSDQVSCSDREVVGG